MQARYVTGILDVCRRCVGVLIGSVLTRTRQYFVPCAYMHAVVPPASSHARLTLDWLAISRAPSPQLRRCVVASHDMCLEVGHVVPCTKTSSSNRRDHERHSLDADVWSAINADEPAIPESLLLFFASTFRNVRRVRFPYCFARGEQSNIRSHREWHARQEFAWSTSVNCN